MTGSSFAGDDVEIVEASSLYRGHVTLDLYRLRHRLFAGGWSEVFTREVMSRGHAAGVLLYDPGRDAVVLVEQFRIGAHAGGRPAWQTEIVCGVIDPGETAEAVVRREAVEESGCTVGDLRPICEAIASPGLMTETVRIFCGRVDAKGAGGVHGLDGENEDIRAFVLPRAEALAWTTDGRITHAPSIIAIQWLELNLTELREAWR